MSPYVINIGRQLGSGGRQIGQMLARELGIAYYDREILDLAAQESGYSAEIFEQKDERRGLLQGVFGTFLPFGTGGAGAAGYYAGELSEGNLFRLQSEAIKKVAARESCIFIGRCADYVLRDHPRAMSVFVAARPADRVARLMDYEHIGEQEARRRIEAGDRDRASYYNFYAAGTWGAAATYDLCIDSSALGIEATAEFILSYVRRRFSL